jgi:hypothetical protein
LVKRGLQKEESAPVASRTARTILLLAVACAMLLASHPARSAEAQAKLEARFTASLAGIPLGKGLWVVDVSGDHYTAAASGKTTGLLRVFSGGYGTAAASGSVNGGRSISANYAATVVSDKKSDEVRIAVVGGTVKEYWAEPPLLPMPDRVPVTEAHRRGVVDPMSAALMPVAGNGDPLRPDACNRILAVFDGRGRFDLALSFKRLDSVKTEKGYAGPVVVCAVRYHPISGHRPARSAIKYLMEARDIEVALAPVTGTRVLVPYRVSVPTTLGTAVLEATHFAASPRAARPHRASNAKTF